MAYLLARRTLYHVAKQGIRARMPAGSIAVMMSTLAHSVAPPNLVSQARPNLVAGGSQRRPVAYGAAAALDYDDEALLPGRHDRRPNGYASPVNGHANGHVNGYHLNGINGHSKAQVQPAREYESDLIVVLDMDECLIHSQFMSQNNVAARWAYQVARRNATYEDSSLFGCGDHHPLGRVDSFKISLPDGDMVQVNKRPYLEEFLEQVTDRYETHVFTAAMEVYAGPVLDTLDPHGTRFSQRWYREHCTFSEQVGAYVKDLTKLPLPKSHRTVLVDNNPLSFLANPENGILVSNFYDDPTDDSLKAVLDLLIELEDVKDVRPELEKRFGLKEALQDLTKNGERAQ